MSRHELKSPNYVYRRIMPPNIWCLQSEMSCNETFEYEEFLYVIIQPDLLDYFSFTNQNSELCSRYPNFFSLQESLAILN